MTLFHVFNVQQVLQDCDCKESYHPAQGPFKLSYLSNDNLAAFQQRFNRYERLYERYRDTMIHSLMAGKPKPDKALLLTDPSERAKFKDYGQAIIAAEQFTKEWTWYEQNARVLAKPEFWIKASDAIHTDNAKLGQLKTLEEAWKSHASFAHYPAEVLMQAADILTELAEVITEAYKELEANEGFIARFKQGALLHFREVYQTLDNKLLGLLPQVGEPEATSYQEFALRYFRYLVEFKQWIQNQQQQIACNMVARLAAANQQQDLAYDDIIVDCVLVLKELGVLTQKQQVPAQPRRTLSSNLFNQFHAYICQYGDAMLQAKLRQFSWFLPHSACINAKLCLANNKQDFLLLGEVQQINHTLAELNYQLAMKKVLTYSGPAVASLATYNLAKRKLQTLFGSANLNQQFGIFIHSTESQAFIDLPTLLTDVTQFILHEVSLLDKLPPKEPATSLITAWHNELIKQTQTILVYAKALLDSLGQQPQTTKIPPNVVQILSQFIMHLNTNKALHKFKQALSRVYSLAPLQARLTQCYRNFLNEIEQVLISPLSTSSSAIASSFDYAQALLPNEEANAMVGLKNIVLQEESDTYPLDVQQLSGALECLGLSSDTLLPAIGHYLTIKVKTRYCKGFQLLQALDNKLQRNLIKDWEHKNHEAIQAAKKEVLSYTVGSRTSPAAIQQSLVLLQAAYSREEYASLEAKLIKEFKQGFMQAYAGERTANSLIITQCRDEALRQFYFLTRWNYLLTKGLSELKQELTQFQTLLHYPIYKEALSQGVEACLKSPAKQLLSPKLSHVLITEFLTDMARERIYAYEDACCNTAIAALLAKLREENADSEDIEDEVHQLRQIYPVFPITALGKQQFETLMQAAEPHGWQLTIALLVEQYGESAQQTQYRLQWLKMLLKNRDFARRYHTSYERQDQGLKGFATFYGEHTLTALQAIQSWLLQGSYRAEIEELLVHYFSEPPVLVQTPRESYKEFHETRHLFFLWQTAREHLAKLKAYLRLKQFAAAKIELRLFLLEAEKEAVYRTYTQILLFPALIAWLGEVLADDERDKKEIITQAKQFEALLLAVQDLIIPLIKLQPQLYLYNQQLQYIAKHHEVVYDNNMQLIGQIQAAAHRWPQVMSQEEQTCELQIGCLLQGLTPKNKALLGQIIEAVSVEVMDKKTVLATELIRRLLNNPAQVMQELKALVLLIKQSQIAIKQQLLNEQLLKHYESWQQTLMTMMLQANAQTHSEQRIISLSLGERRLEPNAIEPQLMTIWQSLDNQALPPGQTHVVKQVFLPDAKSAVYAKFNPSAPGDEFAVRALHRLLLEPDMPYIELLKFPSTSNTTSGPVLLSEAVTGERLDKLWNDAVDFNLEPVAFSRAFIMTLLTNPLDHKPENIVVKRVSIDEEGAPAYELRCIDNDQAFMPPIYKEVLPDSQEAYTIRLGVKTVVYCFEQMKQALHPEVIERILKIDIVQVLDTWLAELERYNNRCLQMFDPDEQEILARRQEQKASVLLVQLEPTLISSLYEKLYSLQELLKVKPDTTAINILIHIHPELAIYYGAALQESISPSKRFWKVTHHDYQITATSEAGVQYGTSTNVHTVLKARFGYIPTWIAKQARIDVEQARDSLKSIHHQYQKINSVRLALLNQRDTSAYQALSHQDVRDKVIAGIEWGPLPASLQQFILEAMVGTAFRRLNLANCHSLTSLQLIKLLQYSPKLQRLNLSGCQQLKLDVKHMVQIAKHCEYLEELNLNGHESLNGLYDKGILGYYPINFNNLKYLEISNCSNIARVNIKAPSLTHLWANNCRSLAVISTKSKALRQLELKNCEQLTDEGLVSAVTCAEFIDSVSLTGCSKLTLPEKKKLFPPLCFIPRLELEKVMATLLNPEAKHVVMPLTTNTGLTLLGAKFTAVESAQDVVLSPEKILVLRAGYTPQLINQDLFIQPGNYPLKIAAIQALATLWRPNEVALALLLQATDDTHPVIRKKAVAALAKLPEMAETVINRLLQKAEDSNKEIRAAAIYGLSNLVDPNPRVINVLINCANDSDLYIKGLALEALAKLPKPSEEVIALLASCVQTGNAMVRGIAIKGLIALPNPNEIVVTTLFQCINDQNAAVKKLAIEGLAKFANSSQTATTALLRYSTDKDPLFRCGIFRVLRDVNHPTETIIAVLIHGMKDEDEQIRELVVQALGKLDQPNAAIMEILQQALQDSSLKVQAAARLALNRWMAPMDTIGLSAAF